MQNLEVRNFSAGQIIYHELDECLEALFVVQGNYNVGYEVNKHLRYRTQFGPSTVIGVFNMSFQKRMNFIYKAQTHLVCYGIRKREWLRIMNAFPQFQLEIKNKSLSFYFTKLYMPLTKLKNDDIEFFEQRKDYN